MIYTKYNTDNIKVKSYTLIYTKYNTYEAIVKSYTLIYAKYYTDEAIVKSYTLIYTKYNTDEAIVKSYTLMYAKYKTDGARVNSFWLLPQGQIEMLKCKKIKFLKIKVSLGHNTLLCSPANEDFFVYNQRLLEGEGGRVGYDEK